MTDSVLRLDADDIWRVIDAIDPVAVLAEALIKRTIGQSVPRRESATGLVPWTAEAPAGDSAGDPAADYVLFEDRSRGLNCAMPAEILRVIHAAAIAALATRELLAPGGLTVAVLGTRFAIHVHLAVLARHVPDIVHVAVRITDNTEGPALEPKLVDQLDLAGIGLSVVTAVAETLFGANLVIAASEEAFGGPGRADAPTVHDLVRGTLLVNASGHDLPGALLDHVDQVYVDDLALLAGHPGRDAAARAEHDNTRTGGDTRPPAIAADLGLLLTGAHHGREQQDDIVVVELLSVHAPDLDLADAIAETARRRGIGVRVPA
jgi:ornithine cyclodeaminase/alanine dehydrogenase-like protein (mu-crystallin family)